VYGRPLVYSLSGVGVAIVNDFKSMEGDKQFGLQSIPLLLGVDTAKWLAAAIPNIVQLSVAAYLHSISEDATAAFVLATLLPQLYLQWTLLLKDPLGNDMKYVALSQPWLTFGLLATTLCIGRHEWSSTM